MTSIVLKPVTPQTLTSLTTESTVGGIAIDWDTPVVSNFWETEIWTSPVNDRSTATKLTSTVGTSYYISDLSGNNVYTWVRAIDIYGNMNGEWTPSNPLAGIVGSSIITATESTVSSGGSGSSSNFAKDLWHEIGFGVITGIDFDSSIITVKGVINMDINPVITGDDNLIIDLRFSIVDETDLHTVINEVNEAVMAIDVSMGYPMPTMIPVYLASLGNTIDPNHTYKFTVEYMVKSSANPSGSVGYTYNSNQLVAIGA